jgi:hypothetical protein
LAVHGLGVHCHTPFPKVSELTSTITPADIAESRLNDFDETQSSR